MHDIDLFFNNILFRYEAWLPMVIGSLLVLSIYFLIRCINGRNGTKYFYWSAVLLLCIVGRFYGVSTTAPISDESEQMLAALTVIRYNDYFGHVFVGTHGPLITMPIVFLHLLGIKITYVTVHILATIIQFLSGFIIYKILRELRLGSFAIAAVFPYFLFLAFALHPQLTTYNAELVTLPFPLFSLLQILHYRNNRRRSDLILAGISLGLVIYLKIQFLPHAFAVALVGFFVIWKEGNGLWRQLGIFCLAMLAPSVLLMTWALFDPTIPAYYQKIYAFQLEYLTTEAVGFLDKLGMFRYMLLAFIQNDSATILQGIFVPLVIGCTFAICTLWKSRQGKKSLEGVNAAILLILLAFSIYAVIAPGRAFPHYLLAAIPVIYLIYGYALYGISKHCPQSYILFFIIINSLPFCVASLTNDTLHSSAKISELRSFSNHFLDTLKRCTRNEQTLFVTNPYYGLYIAARSVSPLPGVAWLFDFDGKLTIDEDKFIEYMKSTPPEVFVDVLRDPEKGRLDKGFPRLAHLISARYTSIFSENNATIWCRNSPNLQIVGEGIPCSVNLNGFSDIETNANKSYSYRWTLGEEPTITFPADGQSLAITYRIISPLFDNDVEIVVNGVAVKKLLITKDANINDGEQEAVVVTSRQGINSLSFRLSHVNSGETVAVINEKRPLGVQFLFLEIQLNDGTRPIS